jgi:hypothetical protein
MGISARAKQVLAFSDWAPVVGRGGTHVCADPDAMICNTPPGLLAKLRRFPGGTKLERDDAMGRGLA